MKMIEVKNLVEIPELKNENEVMNLICEIHNKFMEMDRKHPGEMGEWFFFIHRLQGIIEHRILQTFLTNEFPTY